MSRRLFAFLLLLSTPALAGDTQLAVGQTLVVSVGASRGIVCDDLSIVSVEMNTDPVSQANQVTFKGLKPGTTTCRAGNVALGSPVRLFEVSVHLKVPEKGG